MKRTVHLAIVICMLIPFASCAQNKQNTKNESADAKTSVAEYHKISAEEAKKMLDADSTIILLDVRSEAEYNEKHITGAKLFPLPDIESKAASVLPDKNAVIMVYCRSGARSRSAANLLVSMGYSNVYDIGGGIINWSYSTE